MQHRYFVYFMMSSAQLWSELIDLKENATQKCLYGVGCGGGLVVSALASCSDSINVLYQEKTKIQEKETGNGPPLKKVSLWGPMMKTSAPAKKANFCAACWLTLFTFTLDIHWNRGRGLPDQKQDRQILLGSQELYLIKPNLNPDPKASFSNAKVASQSVTRFIEKAIKNSVPL